MKNVNSNSQTFITPEGVITMSNIKIDHIKCLFSAEVGVKINRKKLVTHEVSGKITRELQAWLTHKDRKVYLPIADETKEGGIRYDATGEMQTGFRFYLNKVGIDFIQGGLRHIVRTLVILVQHQQIFSLDCPCFREFENVCRHLLKLHNIVAALLAEHIPTGHITDTQLRKRSTRVMILYRVW